MMIAITFPGQGSQKVGMGNELLSFSSFRSFLEEKAEKYHLEELVKLAFEGPQERINQTEVAQPLLFLFDLAYFNLFQTSFPVSSVFFFAGHSLGEYAALVAAEVIEFEEAFFVVKKRGELMAKEARKSDGGMLAVLKISREKAEEIAEQTGVQIANYNSPQQFVFSGRKADLNFVVEKVKEAGGKAIPLAVSGAFHSKFMRAAGEKLFSYLEKLNFNYENAQRVVFNLTGKPLLASESLPEILAQQVYSPVRWQDSIEFIVSKNINTFVELGPGRVLTGLLKYICPEAQALTFDNSLEFENLKSLLGGKNV